MADTPLLKRRINIPTPNARKIAENLLSKLAMGLAVPILFIEFLKKHDGIRKLLIFWAIFTPAVHIFFPSNGLATLMAVAMLALNFVYAIFFMIIQFGSMFWFMGRTRSTEIHPGDPKTITWDDYWGQKHLVERVKQWNKLLVDREVFRQMGGQALNGLLMTGPPGTGKTMMAKAMAGSGGVAFLGVEGSTFRGMFWGMDTMKVMGFVGKARKLAMRYGACVAYIDEIDAIGTSRGGVQGGGAAGGGQVQGQGPMGMMGSGALTRLLYEMDGIEDVGIWGESLNRARGICSLDPVDRGKVMFMGATNRPDVLDPALLRPGRFDQIIQVDEPDEEGRREVILGYLGKVSHGDDIDVDALVLDTPRATPAHIMSVITKDAPRAAVFAGRDYIIQEDLEIGFQEKLLGIANPISNWDPTQKRAVAAHESGHALAMRHWRQEKRFVRLSIIRRGRALGYAYDVDRVDIYAHPQTDWVRDIYVSLAGDIGADVVMGERWTGMGGDMMKVRERVYQMFAHGVFGSFPVLDAPGKGPGKNIDEAVERFMKSAIEQVEDYLRSQMGPLVALTDALVEREDMRGTDAIEIIEEAATGGDHDEEEPNPEG